MLALEDRLLVALGNGLGAQLQRDDVETVCRFIVVLRQVHGDPKTPPELKRLAGAALSKLGKF